MSKTARPIPGQYDSDVAANELNRRCTQLRERQALMTNSDILQIAMRQSAVDSGCDAEDFLRSENRIVPSRKNEGARKYLILPHLCDFTSYGNNIVVSASAGAAEVAREYLARYPMEHCFETPHLHVLIDRLRPLGMNVCFMAEYFLPDVDRLRPLACRFEIRMMAQPDFAGLYLPQWSNALCEARRELDVLGAGAFDGEKLIGLAACSADCASMWQIGVDVLPEYRRQGVASALTSRLAAEILRRGIVPFYCAAWSNLRSVRNAVKSGFRPAWVQMTARSSEYIDSLNLAE